MPPPEARHVVTGAFSYTGSYIARALLDRGQRVTTPPAVALVPAAVLGRAHRDVLLSGAQPRGLTANLLVSHQPPLGHRRPEPWLGQDGPLLGRRGSTRPA
jgi:hypothetical protein